MGVKHKHNIMQTIILAFCVYSIIVTRLLPGVGDIACIKSGGTQSHYQANNTIRKTAVQCWCHLRLTVLIMPE